MKRLINENSDLIRETSDILALTAKAANEAAKQFKSLKFGEVTTTDELHELFTDLPGYLVTKLPLQTFAGIPAKSEKILELMDIDLTGLKAAISEPGTNIGLFCSLATHTKKGFEVDKDKLQQYVESQFRRYIYTEKDNQTFDAITAIKTGLEALHRLHNVQLDNLTSYFRQRGETIEPKLERFF